MDSHLFKTKSIEQLITDVERGERALRRSLSAWDLTLLGIGGIIGTEIFVLTGTAAANQAGPAITMSYLAAGLACAFAALCTRPCTKGALGHALATRPNNPTDVVTRSHAGSHISELVPSSARTAPHTS